MTYKDYVVLKLKEIIDTIELPDEELKKKHKWLKNYDEVNYAMRCGIVKAEVDNIIEKLEEIK